MTNEFDQNSSHKRDPYFPPGFLSASVTWLSLMASTLLSSAWPSWFKGHVVSPWPMTHVFCLRIGPVDVISHPDKSEKGFIWLTVPDYSPSLSSRCKELGAVTSNPQSGAEISEQTDLSLSFNLWPNPKTDASHPPKKILNGCAHRPTHARRVPPGDSLLGRF